MEIQVRRKPNVHDQENVYGPKDVGVSVPLKLGLNVRGALGELNSNTTFASKPANTIIKGSIPCETENKIRRSGRSYKHVQSKVDTGLSIRPVQPSSRPPLRREESTGSLAARAVVSRAALKDAQNKSTELKERVNVFVQAKKVTQVKKKLPTLKENAKEVKSLLNPIRGPTESLCNLKLGDDVSTKAKEVEPIPKLPIEIEDIDAGDIDKVNLLSYYIKDIYRYLTKLETKYAIKKDYLADQAAITGRMRATLIDWLVEVQHQFHLTLETFQLTVGIIDRYLQKVTNLPKSRLQLVGVTALFIASKYEEVYTPTIHDYIFITDNAYTVTDLRKCEIDMLSKLDYSLAKPIPISFLRRFVKAAHGTSTNHHLAKYMVDLCLVDYSMAHYKPSELAAAALCLSLHLLSDEPLTEVWTPTIKYYSEYTLEHLEPIIRKIANIVVGVQKSKFQAVYNKYCNVKLGSVATLSKLKGEAILKLAEQA
ncbi:G2/mitotic-specific cyclin-B [Bicyclus anynana]|uniref:G2/mitotic-specific cyclin-B n=1 Tax=Bicyclus anynana TaxID=110368 RepID=A0A6J1NRA4_BICAN|nr:G2/mitotic-specific cyclin-B [Bicyclus anynana]